MATEGGDHFDEHVVSHRARCADALQRHGDRLRFERADPDRQHAVSVALPEQEQWRRAGRSDPQTNHDDFDH